MAKISQASHPLTITTPLGEDVLLLETFMGEEGLSRLFQFKLEMLSEVSDKVLFDKILGQAVTVQISIPGLPARYFHGIINRFAQGQRAAGADGNYTFVRYEAELVPQAWLLTRRIRSQIFQQVTVIEILKTLLQGLKVDFAVEGTFEKRDYCVQYQESDFAFASRLMEEEGIYYYFKHTKTGHEMVLANTPAKHVDIEKSLVTFEEMSGGYREDERIFGWIKRQAITSGKYTLGDYSFELSNPKLSATKPILQSLSIGTVTHPLKVAGNDALEIYEHPGRFAQRFDGVTPGGGDQASSLQNISTDGERTVGIRMQAEGASGIVIEGRSNHRLFSAGYKFKLEKHYDADGAYVLTRVKHEVSQKGLYIAKRGVEAAFKYENFFECLPAALPFRPARVTPKARVEGPQTAVVVGPAGDEIFTDKYGRVKVQFPWDREGKNDGASSCWVRVGTPWAGKTWGMIHIPRIGQEVIVAFEEGDPDQPIIVGSVYNAANMPPYTLPDMKTQSGMKSRSTLKGTAEHFNELRFEDKKDAEDVYFHGQKDFHRVVENDDDLKVGRHQTREIKNNRTSVIKEGDDTFTIEKGSRIETLKEGNETLTMEKGSRTETLKDGDETVTLEKGQRTHKIQNDDKLDVVEGARTVTVKNDHTLTVSSGNQAITLSQGNYNLSVKMGAISVKADLGAISEEAMEKIELKVGGNSIVIDQSGVTIKGIIVKVEGQGMVQVKGPMVQVNGDAMLTLKGGVTMVG